MQPSFRTDPFIGWPPKGDYLKAQKEKSPANLSICRTQLRRERDSNPRYLAVRRFSRPVHSTTLPSLLRCCIAVLTGAKIRSIFDIAKRFGIFFAARAIFLDFREKSGIMSGGETGNKEKTC